MAAQSPVLDRWAQHEPGPLLRAAALVLVACAALVAIESVAPSPTIATTNDAVRWTAEPAIGSGRAPSLARAEDGALWAVWEDGLHVRAASRASGERAWSAPEPLSAGFAPLVAVDGGAPHAVWVNEIEDRFDVFYSRRIEGRWSLPRNVSGSMAFSSAPSLALAVADGMRFIAWSERGALYFGRSEDGNQWHVGPLAINGEVVRGNSPTLLAMDRDHVEAAWQTTSDTNAAIHHATWSQDRWSLPEELSVPAQLDPSQPALAQLSDGRRAVAWRHGRPASIALLVGYPGGWGWPEDAGGLGLLGGPALATGAGAGSPAAHLLWVDPDPAIGLLHRARVFGALGTGDPDGWTATSVVSPGIVAEPAMLVDVTGEVHAAWARRAADGAPWRVYVGKRSGPLAVNPTVTPTNTVASPETPVTPPPSALTATTTPTPTPIHTHTPSPTSTTLPSAVPTGGPVLGTATPIGTPTPSGSASPTLAPESPTPTRTGGSATATESISPVPSVVSHTVDPLFLPWARAFGSRDEAAVALRTSESQALSPWSAWRGFQNSDPNTVHATSLALAARDEPIDGAWSGIDQAALRSDTDAWEPALIVDGAGTTHLVWAEGADVLHASRSVDGEWSSPARVAAGSSPTLASDAQGRAHMLLTNRFGGRFDIFHLQFENGRWSLPVNVSHTSSYSAGPVLKTGLGADPLMAAWSELGSGGVARVHVGRWDGVRWRHTPVLQARGLGPDVAPRRPVGRPGADELDGLVLAWHARSRPDAPFEVLATERRGGAWSLPERVSEGSEEASVAALGRARGELHLIWRTEGQKAGIRHSRRADDRWSDVIGLSEDDAGRGRLLVDDDGRRDVVWSALGEVWSAQGIGSGTWARSIVPGAGGAREVAVARAPDGEMRLAFTRPRGTGGSEIWAIERAACDRCTGWLPMLIRGR